MDKITEILSQQKKLLTEIYFDLQLHFEEKYGKDALVLMEIVILYTILYYIYIIHYISYSGIHTTLKCKVIQCYNISISVPWYKHTVGSQAKGE